MMIVFVIDSSGVSKLDNSLRGSEEPYVDFIFLKFTLKLFENLNLMMKIPIVTIKISFVVTIDRLGCHASPVFDV